MKTKYLIPVLSIALLSWPKIAAADCAMFGGRAAGVQANALGNGSMILSDTGDLERTGGTRTASLLSGSVAGLVEVNVMHATATGDGSSSQSEASVGNLNLTVAGNTISADFLVARANAYCAGDGAAVNGSTEIDGLMVNGQAIPVTGSPNQTLSLDGGVTIVLNEQASSLQDQDGIIAVNALHVTVPGVMDAVIAPSFAAVSGGANTPVTSSPAAVSVIPLLSIGGPPPPPTQPPPAPTPCDFVTGGGWITTGTGSKGTFAVGGGFRHGQYWGHLEYHDHGTGLNVHGTGVTAYTMGLTGPTSRHIEGTADVNGQSGFTYMVDVADNGEPGRNDTFDIQVPNVYMAGTASSPLLLSGGGNIQLHTHGNSCK